MITIDDIDIYVKTYNRAHLITQTLDSILNQTVKIKNFTILDNNSSDNTEKVINKYQKKYKQIKYIKTYNKYGNFLKAQELLKKNNKKYVMTCHDDDLLHPEFFEKVLIAINSCKYNPAFVVSSITRFPNTDLIASSKKESLKNPFTNKQMKSLKNDFIFVKNSKDMAKFLLICETTYYSKFIISIGSGIYRRDLFLQHVPLNDIYGKLDDTPILISMASKGGGIIIADNEAYYHRCHTSSDSFDPNSGNTIQQLINYVAAYSKQFNFFLNRKYLKKIPKMLSNIYYTTPLLKPELYKIYSLENFIKVCINQHILPKYLIKDKIRIRTIKNIEREFRNKYYKKILSFIFSVKKEIINNEKYKTITILGFVIKLKK